MDEFFVQEENEGVQPVQEEPSEPAPIELGLSSEVNNSTVSIK